VVGLCDAVFPTRDFGPKVHRRRIAGCWFLVAWNCPFSIVATRFALRKKIGISNNQQLATSNFSGVYIEGKIANRKNDAKDAKRGFLWTKKRDFSCCRVRIRAKYGLKFS
jgi:hypothetical protein